MARDYIDIGSTPTEEDCAQVGQPDYEKKARAECARFIQLIRQTLGEEPEGARLAVKSNPHDFGTYYEVVCYFEDSNEEATSYAYRCEAETPTKWDPVFLQCSTCGHVPLRQSYARRGDPCLQCTGTKFQEVICPDGKAPNGKPVAAPLRVCDGCLSAADDYGIPDRTTQEMLMMELGADLEDHLCDVVEAPDVVTSCACACRGRA